MPNTAFPVQLALEYNPPTPFGEGPRCVEGILDLYTFGVKISLTLKEGEDLVSVDAEVAGSVYTLMVKKDAGYFVTASCGAQCKRSFFPLQGRGRHWDTSQ
jgi:hypothetical protein